MHDAWGIISLRLIVFMTKYCSTFPTFSPSFNELDLKNRMLHAMELYRFADPNLLDLTHFELKTVKINFFSRKLKIDEKR